MAQTLTLEYSCTADEVREAQALCLRKQVGGGSRWRTIAVLLSFIAFALFLLCFLIRNEVPPKYRVHATVAILLLVTALTLWKTFRRQVPTSANRVQLTDRDLTISFDGTMIASPWSAFNDFLESPNLFVLVDRTKSSLVVLPKRAFPDESWRTWFRSIVAVRPSTPNPVQSSFPATATSTNQIRLAFRLGLQDYFDRALASWQTRLVIIAVAAAILGACIHLGVHPSPSAVYSGTQVYFMFMLPFMFVMAGMLITVFTVYPWLLHKQHLISQEVVLSDDSISLVSSDGTAVVPWNTFPFYKETKRSFILWAEWGGRRGRWLLLPKRGFATVVDFQRGRTLFGERLRRSKWFWG